MWYIFDENNKCITCIDYEPNKDDLKTRNEFCVESDEVFSDFTRLVYKNKIIIEQEPSLDELKEVKLNKAGELFAQKRDAIRWVKIDNSNTYGFDCASEDITNFTAAYIGLSNDLTKSGTTFYKVWLTPETKGVVSLNITQMTNVYNVVRNSQFESYAWYEQIKQKINACQSKEDLDAIVLE